MSRSSSERANVRIFEDPESLARGAAEVVLRRVRTAIELRGTCSLLLAGGSTPHRLYELLRRRLEPSHRSGLDPTAIHFFFGDERYVPPDDPSSNFGAARRALLASPVIPERNVHPMPTAAGDPEEDACRYEQELREFFAGADLPRLDLALLGMGSDGHTASLFPGHAVLEEKERWVLAPWIGKLSSQRLTVTLPVLLNAAAILFLVSGRDKAATVESVLSGEPGAALPASLVRPVDGELIWLLDREAASLL